MILNRMEECLKSFSERFGFKKPREALQLESMDGELRTALWNWMYVFVFKGVSANDVYWKSDESAYSSIYFTWAQILKRPLDALPGVGHDVSRKFREIVSTGEFHQVYSVVEGLLHKHVAVNNSERDNAISALNYTLDREGSGYRYVGSELVPITSPLELEAIDQAMNALGRFDPAKRHIERALQLLSDRKAPDYRNSIKESISAVEASCRVILGEPKVTLADALRAMDVAGIKFHPAFREGLTRLYGYTSDKGGIRHALSDEVTPSASEARFMLVTCSAFMNLLIEQDASRRSA